MKVICINNGGFQLSLTSGKLYEVKHQGLTKILVSNDRGIDYWYDDDRFLSLKDWRDKQLNQILN